MVTNEQLVVASLGPCRVRSPLPMSNCPDDGVGDFVCEDERVLHDVRIRGGQTPSVVGFERAGAREQIFFEPARTRAAVVTAGGLCPGLNNVIRTLYFELKVNYGIEEVLGIRYGYRGLEADAGLPPMVLTHDLVDNIQHHGGTVIGTSRCAHDAKKSADYLLEHKIDILFCVGGDGTQRGAHQIAEEVTRRKLPIAIVGIPKTIDNDIKFCERTFGFFTAVAEAELVIDRAHTEACCVPNGVGLVKLMGREAGFIAAAATIASGEVNFTLIPEVPFTLEGERGLLAKLERRLAARHHAVVVVAEGAGQELLPAKDAAFDASGNRKLGDIGVFLKQQIQVHCQDRRVHVDVKYFDPSYHIRSCPASTVDSLLCEQFARHAAHAGMAGKTNLLIGTAHSEFVHVPLVMSIGQKKRLEPESDWWTSVTAITGQDKW
ncbi:MAG: ATP-dependent 6-phosphofructokinase [Pirellulales bacterium]